MADPDPQALVEVLGVSKDYRGLRPLRVERITLRPGDRLAILGFDEVAAEVLINLITGAVLPDTGEVHLFGRSTASIADGADWVALVDRFGIVSRRAVLLEDFTVAQNLAVPFTLEIEPVPGDVAREVGRLIEEVGLHESTATTRVRDTPPGVRARIRLARALALNPSVLLLEHPSAGLAEIETERLGAVLDRLAGARRLAVLTLTADRTLAEAIGGRWGRWHAASGSIRPASFWSRWSR